MYSGVEEPPSRDRPRRAGEWRTWRFGLVGKTQLTWWRCANRPPSRTHGSRPKGTTARGRRHSQGGRGRRTAPDTFEGAYALCRQCGHRSAPPASLRIRSPEAARTASMRHRCSGVRSTLRPCRPFEAGVAGLTKTGRRQGGQVAKEVATETGRNGLRAPRRKAPPPPPAPRRWRRQGQPWQTRREAQPQPSGLPLPFVTR